MRSYKMKFYSALLLALLACVQLAAQTVTISGKVNDKEGVLQGATVFLAGTKDMTATNEAGNFQLKQIPPGNYQLVVRMMGFNTFLKSIAVFDKPIDLKIALEPSVALLKEVTIRPNKEWFKNLEIFKKQFIGENSNATKCKILNAEVLTFTNNKKTHILKAETDRLLNIENRALGYKLTYVLNSFEYDTRKNSVVFQGFEYFENLKGTPAEEQQWKANRNLAYEGSVQQFVRSLYNNTTRKDGFLVYQVKNWVPGGYGYRNNKDSLMRRKRIAVDTLVDLLTKDYKKFTSNAALFVVYTKKIEDPQYQLNGYSLSQLYNDQILWKSQSSVVNLMASSVMIDGRGAFYRPQDLFFEGYMGWQKVSNLTPFGFEPDVD